LEGIQQRVLFKVYAYADHTSFVGNQRTEIGSLVTTSAFVSSKFGDEHLFFRHQYMEDDFAKHPEWLKQMGKDVSKYCGADAGTKPPA